MTRSNDSKLTPRPGTVLDPTARCGATVRCWVAAAVLTLQPLAVNAELTNLGGYGALTLPGYPAVGDETEPSVAIRPGFPLEIVIAWMRDPSLGSLADSECWTARSANGGNTWTDVTQHLKTVGRDCYDVSVVYSKDGKKIYLSRVEATSNFSDTQDILRATTVVSGNPTWVWDTDVIVETGSNLAGKTDRPWVTVDRSNHATYGGHVYASRMSLYLTPTDQHHVYAQRFNSTLQAQFPDAEQVDGAGAEGKCVAWHSIGVDGDGTAYMSWRSKRSDVGCPDASSGRGSCFSMATSANGGSNWTSRDKFPLGAPRFPLTKMDFVDYPEGGQPSELGCKTPSSTSKPWEDTFPYPVVAANPAVGGKAAVVWLDSRFDTQGPEYTSDVVISRTTDGGTTWTTPSLTNKGRINTDPVNNNVLQDRPWAAYNDTGTRLWAVWRDRRDTAGTGVKAHLYSACSTNDGASWVPTGDKNNLRVSSDVLGYATHNASNKDGFIGVAGTGDYGVAIWTVDMDANPMTANRKLHFGKMKCDPNPVTLFSDDFESYGNNGPLSPTWDVGSPYTAKAKDYAMHAGTLGALLTRAGGTNISMERLQDTSGYTGVTVQYWRKAVNLDALPPADNLKVEWSADGINWNEIETVAASFDWTQQTWPLPSGAGDKANFRLRFKLTANSTDEMAFIDDVVIRGN